MATRIENNSTSLFVLSYALATINAKTLVVYLDLAPQHPKMMGAIWASLVNGTNEPLSLYDGTRRMTVYGLGRRYERLEVGCPDLADRGRSRPKFLRLIAPEATRIEKVQDGFFVMDCWGGMPLGTALAAMLERGTQYPMLMGWGDYLLAAAEKEGFALPLTTGEQHPMQGYHLHGNTPWADLISRGVKEGHITLEGHTQGIPVTLPVQVEAEPALVADGDL